MDPQTPINIQPTLTDYDFGSRIANVVDFFFNIGDSTSALAGSSKFQIWYIIFAVADILILLIILYYIFRMYDYERLELEKFKIKKEPEPGSQNKDTKQTRSLAKKKEQAWTGVTQFIQSPAESDWKIAILEADSILDSLLKDLGYEGENLGSRLRLVRPDHMRSLKDAGEAHGIRNRIAHDTGFQLTYDQAKDVIGKFERVFREFDYI